MLNPLPLSGVTIPAKRPRGRPKGMKLSPETRAKISAARKAAWADPAVRAKLSIAKVCTENMTRNAKIVRFSIAGSSFAEIAATVGVSKNVVAGVVFRARRLTNTIRDLEVASAMGADR